MSFSVASVDKVGDWWTYDPRREVRVFLTSVPIDHFLLLVDEGEELGLIVRVERPVREILRDEPWELDGVVS